MIFIMPNRCELQTLHGLKDRGFAISTLRFPSGALRNVAIDAKRHHEAMVDLWLRLTGVKP